MKPMTRAERAAAGRGLAYLHEVAGDDAYETGEGLRPAADLTALLSLRGRVGRWADGVGYCEGPAAELADLVREQPRVR